MTEACGDAVRAGSRWNPGASHPRWGLSGFVLEHRRNAVDTRLAGWAPGFEPLHSGINLLG